MEMTGAQAVAEALAARGVDTVFGVPGGHNLPLFGALERAGIETVGARHEQGAGFMAEAWSRVAGRPGIVVTTAGPGLTNTLTPIAHAAADGASICVLALDNYLPTLPDSSGQFHGISDMGRAVSAFAELAGCATTPATAGRLAAQAFDQLVLGRARPVVVQLPSDVMTKLGEVETAVTRTEHLAPSSAAVGDLAARLANAQSPVLFAGAGAVRSGAHDELTRLAERLGCPVVTTVSGRGAIPDSHPLATGPIWDRFGPLDGVAAHADLVLCVGTRLTPLATRNGVLPIGGRMSCIDVEPEGPSRLYSPVVAVRGDARQVLAALLEEPALPDRGGEPATFTRKVQQAANRWRATFASGAPQASELLAGLAAGTPRNTVFACDMTVLGYWAQRFLPVNRPGGLISPYYFGTLGYGLPAAIGAQIADPSATVIALCGDAGLVMNSQEMATAQHLNLPVTVVVVNDNGYAAVHADEQRTGVGALAVSHITNPKFDLLAQAYGWHHQRVDADGTRVTAALRRAAENTGPSLIEVVLDAPLPMPYQVKW